MHFASALTLLGLRDGESASYAEIAEILQREGSRPRRDSEELFRRMVFNICIANVDDHETTASSESQVAEPCQNEERILGVSLDRMI